MAMSKQAREGKDNMKSWSANGKDAMQARHEGGKGKGAKTVTSLAMKKFGRNMARAKNQGA